MNTEVLSHDVKTGIASVKFTYKDIVHEEVYNLKMVVPGSERVFQDLGQEFTKELQLKALEGVATRLKAAIDDGTYQPRLAEGTGQSVAPE